MEYAIVKGIENSLIDLKIDFFYTTRAENDNFRDKKHFDNILKELQNNFIKCGLAIVSWMKNQNWFTNATKILVDRLPDSEGVEGIVTDIRLIIKYMNGAESTKEISLKHNHDALKHPRLPRLPDQCGISDLSLKEDYIKKHDIIWDEFFIKAKNLKKDSTKFSEVKAIDDNIIDNYLYEPLINLVKDFLLTNANNKRNATKFFQFLTSHINFYVIKNETDQIVIKYFIDITPPSSFTITYPFNGKKTTCLIKFDNKWDVTMRLHTASSEYYRNGKINKSTKFDVICTNIDSVINIETVKKPTL